MCTGLFVKEVKSQTIPGYKTGSQTGAAVHKYADEIPSLCVQGGNLGLLPDRAKEVCVCAFPDLVLWRQLFHVGMETSEARQEMVDHHLLRNDCTRC